MTPTHRRSGPVAGDGGCGGGGERPEGGGARRPRGAPRRGALRRRRSPLAHRHRPPRMREQVAAALFHTSVSRLVLLQLAPCASWKYRIGLANCTLPL